MKISDIIHNQTCKVNAIEENLRSENNFLNELQWLKGIIEEYKVKNPSVKFYPWCVNNGYELDFSCDVMDLIDTLII